MALRGRESAVYFLYRAVSRIRHELVGRADSEARACALAIEHSLRQKHTIAVNACTPGTLHSRFVGCFRDGVSSEHEHR